MKIKRYLLILILLIAAGLRLWRLGSIPPGLTPDEASLGYNAYSILKTGKDEYGKVLPLIFKSFGDYKPGLYVYLIVPSIAIFGLNEFAVRLPSALAGVLSVYLIYLIVYELFKDKRLSLISAFVASITPWLIYFSRGAWEVNVALTLTLAGIYFFLKSLRKPKFLTFCFLLFALSLLAYQGAKLSTGIVLVLLVICFWKGFIKISKKYLIYSILVGLVISSPIILSLFTGKVGRLNVFSVFSYPRSVDYLQAQLDQGDEKVGSLTYYLFHSEDLNFKRGILGRYFNHFSGRFLFFEGDWANPRHTAPYQGMFLLSDLVIFLIGFLVIVKTKLNKELLFVILWLALAPLPAVLSRDQVHAVRSFNLVIPLIIILAFGLNKIWEDKKLLVLFIGLYFLAFSYFLDAYFVHVPNHNSQLWEYGYKQIVETVTPIQDQYKQVKIQQSYAQPYIYFLFYGSQTNPQKYDPAKYQQQAKLVDNSSGDVGQVEHLDNIYFAPIDWSVNRGEHGTLFVADTIRIPPDDSKDETLFKVVKEIKYLNNRDMAFRIIEVR
jgi:4-amino-4-deoxy-L-arabinose transferase-like glycosyltransferase